MIPTDPHPFLVHFPIAFVAVAGVGAVIEPLRGFRLSRTVDLFLMLSALGAIGAAASGEAARGGIELTGAPFAMAESHERAGSFAAWLSGAAVLARLGLRGLARRRGLTSDPGRGVDRGFRTLVFGSTLLCVATATLVWMAAQKGGVLVHELGVTQSTAPRSAETNTESSGQNRFEAVR